MQATSRWPPHTSSLQLPPTSRQASTDAPHFDMTALKLHGLLFAAAISVSPVCLCGGQHVSSF